MEYIPVTAYISKDGDSLEFKIHDQNDFRVVNDNDNIDPDIKKYIGKDLDYSDVIEFLEKMEENEGLAANVKLFHRHNSEYSGHKGFKGVAHEETVDNALSFVKMRQLSHSNNYTAGWTYANADSLTQVKTWFDFRTYSNPEFDEGKRDKEQGKTNRFAK